ncbi:MAG TPA: metalloregulator ArsR/SmtB family transcription factor [Azospirillaceae bacterium]|nr:metalloregulator ArsR/SmtB family transcription factor [Azospirillaceae bacterium]
MDAIDTLFKALADPARIRILEFLSRPDAACCSTRDRVCACDLEALLGLSQPTVSHHMKLLVGAGLVQAEKDGRWVHYRLNRPRFHELARWLQTTAGPVGDETGSTRIAAE